MNRAAFAIVLVLNVMLLAQARTGMRSSMSIKSFYSENGPEGPDGPQGPFGPQGANRAADVVSAFHKRAKREILILFQAAGLSVTSAFSSSGDVGHSDM